MVITTQTGPYREQKKPKVLERTFSKGAFFLNKLWNNMKEKYFLVLIKKKRALGIRVFKKNVIEK